MFLDMFYEFDLVLQNKSNIFLTIMIWLEIKKKYM